MNARDAGRPGFGSSFMYAQSAVIKDVLIMCGMNTCVLARTMWGRSAKPKENKMPNGMDFELSNMLRDLTSSMDTVNIIEMVDEYIRSQHDTLIAAARLGARCIVCDIYYDDGKLPNDLLGLPRSWLEWVFSLRGFFIDDYTYGNHKVSFQLRWM